MSCELRLDKAVSPSSERKARKEQADLHGCAYRESHRGDANELAPLVFRSFSPATLSVASGFASITKLRTLTLPNGGSAGTPSHTEVYSRMMSSR